MECSVLTVKEQRRSMSSMKKKKRISKSVLCVPEVLSISRKSDIADEEQASLVDLLTRLLPVAKLPQLPKTWPRKINKQDLKADQDKTVGKLAKEKRKQLSLGVNAVSRATKNHQLAAVLFADDVRPSYLISHLLLLCGHSQVPYLLVPKFRDILSEAIGFETIALGFRKPALDFLPIINHVVKNCDAKPIKPKSTSLKAKDEVHEKPAESENAMPMPKFDYLRRVSRKQRVFIPEETGKKKVIEKETKEVEFIPISMETSNEEVSIEGISTKLLKRFSDRSFELDEEVEKKRVRKDWLIDKRGTKGKYATAKVMRVQSNVNRQGKRSGKKKKNKLV